MIERKPGLRLSGEARKLASMGEISPHTSSMADTSRLLQSAAVPAEVWAVSSSPVHF